MGPGCPDMIHRDVWMSIRNNKYLVAVKCKTYSVLDKSKIVEIYDLEEDSKQMSNILELKRNDEEIKNLLAVLEHRYKEICISTKNILEKIESFDVVEKEI